MVNDRPGVPVTDASQDTGFVGARTGDDLARVADSGVAWDYDSRDEGIRGPGVRPVWRGRDLGTLIAPARRAVRRACALSPCPRDPLA